VTLAEAAQEFVLGARDRAITNRSGTPDEPEHAHQPSVTTIRQRIESIYWTLRDQPGLERHAACIHLNHQLGRPGRSLTTYRRGAESTIEHLRVAPEELAHDRIRSVKGG
jgi:hypothetical protein